MSCFTLSLSSNAIGDIGAKALIDALKASTQVINLDLEDTDISPEMQKKLSDLMDKS